MCRQPTSMLARDGKKIMFSMPAQRLELLYSPFFAETGEAASFAVFYSSWRQDCGTYGLGWRVPCSAVACALRVGRSRNEYRNSDSSYVTCETGAHAEYFPDTSRRIVFSLDPPVWGREYLLPSPPSTPEQYVYKTETGGRQRAAPPPA